ncbi:hypothetical protein [Brevundimonas sp.]|uniref:hypothetical protein n=1 Tax=Brevundimonas sp. TaxID=1871086 RepID=UPI001ACC151A|nr:hypothetical protein [Brevundimonas sp.]MBN9466557.1 hypothetical protein [Brevundimonas sp.]
MKSFQISIIGGALGACGLVAVTWLMSFSQTLKWIEDHDGLAGWLQAIFSVVAICVTGWALIRQERRQEVIGRIDRYTARGDQLESLTAISGRLEELISEVRFNTPYILDDHDDDDWSAVEDASSEIAIHEARDPEIAGALLTLKIESAKLRRNLLKYVAAENAEGPTSPDWRPFNEHFQKEIIISMGEAVRAHMLLCGRLRQVAEKRKAAERMLRVM